jgi:hypothetical protein
MGILRDIHSVSAESLIALSVIAAVLYTMVLYTHRWLSRLAGHAIPPVQPSRHIP